METVGTYILKVCCCALIAGAVKTIGGKGPASQVRNLICGLFLAFAIISPLRQIRLEPVLRLPEQLHRQGLEISVGAVNEVSGEISDIIIERLRAYILEEANSLGAQIQIRAIGLDPETLLPNRVELAGSIAPYAKGQLSSYIQNTLGIDKEAQKWIK